MPAFSFPAMALPEIIVNSNFLFRFPAQRLPVSLRCADGLYPAARRINPDGRTLTTDH